MTPWCLAAIAAVLLGSQGLAAAPGAAAPAANPGSSSVAPGTPRYDATKYSQRVTACDRLASHPDDPDRVAPGRTREQIAEDFPGAIAACESAVALDPGNPRLRYQLARVYGYSGQGRLAMPHRARTIEADYPQGLFVNGFLYLTGQNENPKDLCKAGELIRASAIEGRLAGLIAFPRYLLQGRFKGCSLPTSREEMLGFLTTAQKQSNGDFYQGLLIEMLREDLQTAAPLQ